MTAEAATAAPGGQAARTRCEVEHLDVTYRVRGQDRLALRDVSFRIGRSESYGLVGESGSGKSTVALALTRYLPRNGRVSAGTIAIDGMDPLAMGESALRRLRASTVSMVYQEPGKALNPSIRVGRQVAEVYEVAGLDRQGGPGAGRGDAPQGPDLRSRAGSWTGTRISFPAGWRSGR